MEELRKGEQGECPICLEAFEDAVLTPCAHCLCRECLLASWRNSSSGLCPVCRYHAVINPIFNDLDLFCLIFNLGNLSFVIITIIHKCIFVMQTQKIVISATGKP